MNFKIGTIEAAQSADCILFFLTKDDGTVWDKMNLPQYALIKRIIAKNKKAIEYKTITSTYFGEGELTQKLIVVGLGAKKDFDANKVQSLAGQVAAMLDAKQDKKVAVIAPFLGCTHGIGAMVRGLALGAYKYTEYKTEDTNQGNITVEIVSEVQGAAQAVKEATTLAKNIYLVRDLINRPGNAVYPEIMAEIATEIASQLKITCEVLDVKQMAEKNMRAILAVGQGSVHEPCMITLKYQGATKTTLYVAYVGKGITFDSGGISLKPGDGMGEMKDDMSGSAAVLGAIKTIAELKLPVNVMAVLACAENMPGGNAQRPGDIITAANGKTIEVVNTDAEGRLVLADAVWYACEQGAAQVIDVASLTGAAIIALGNDVSALVSNDADLVAKIIAAGNNVAERYWQLPNVEELHEAIKSEVADLRNTAGRPGGTITGGLFIGEFIKKGIPWVHIDIGGTASASKARGFWTYGGTGVGVATLVEFAKEASC